MKFNAFGIPVRVDFFFVIGLVMIWSWAGGDRVGLFAAVLFTYRRLTADSEIIVMRAVGLGPGQLARAGLLMAGVVTATAACALQVRAHSTVSADWIASRSRVGRAGNAARAGAARVSASRMTGPWAKAARDSELARRTGSFMCT